MTVAETLRAARALIERGWTRDASARDGIGDPVSPRCPRAVKWCALGALLRAAEDGGAPPRLGMYAALCRAIGSWTARDVGWGETEDRIARWNDRPERTLGEVLAAYDRAIEAEEAALKERA